MDKHEFVEFAVLVDSVAAVDDVDSKVCLSDVGDRLTQQRRVQ